MPVVRTITLGPGDSTGWHYHPGRVDVVVLAGTLTRTLHDGRVEVSRAGDCLVEHAGPVHIHVGHNHGTVPVVLIARYEAPAGRPLAVPVPVPGWCPGGAAAAPGTVPTDPAAAGGRGPADPRRPRRTA
ncbi:cupin domain-containing protein [Kitasatospora sp. NPDC015120]|uniref:cupin domain-containing protein n=1 Tax=Kitasatospora sp. NPDC015120 TaxID=3364023 RepID=UPI0036F497DD